MRNVLVLLVGVVLAGCSDDSTGRQSCSRLGWSCGMDDFGTSCGSCTASQTCNSGRCTAVAPTCSVPAFAACVVGGPTCCAAGGTATLCSTLASGQSYCEPLCASDAVCDTVSGTSGRFACVARNDGIRVCAPR